MTTHESDTTRFRPESSSICTLVEDLLPLYVEGEVSPGTRDMIVEHIAQCAHCAGFLAGSQSTRAQLRQDQTSRQRVTQKDAPAFRAIHATQFLMVIGGIVGLFVGVRILRMLLWNYGASGLITMMIPFGALAAAAFAIVMLVRQRQGASALSVWLPLGVVGALGGLGLLVLATQYGIFRIVQVALTYSPIYIIFRLLDEFGGLFVVGGIGLVVTALAAVAYALSANKGTAKEQQ